MSGGLLHSAGGWAQVLSLWRKGSKAASDQRIFGSKEFIERLLADAALGIGAEPSVAQAYVREKLPVEATAIPGLPTPNGRRGRRWDSKARR